MRHGLTLILTATTLAAVTPAAHAAQLSQRPLKRGDRGSDVRELQRVITKLKVKRLAADGAYGSQTASAVKRYERHVRIKVDARVSVGEGRGMLRRAGKPLPARRAKKAAPATPAVVPDGTAVYPVIGKVTVGEGFGDRGGRHQGVDLLNDCGNALVAVSGATITKRATAGAAGRHLIITQPDGTEWIYMHMSTVSVHTGDTVTAGQKVGEVGQTGNATACHLHIELRPAPGRDKGARPIDPMPTLKQLPKLKSPAAAAPKPAPTPADPAGGAAAG